MKDLNFFATPVAKKETSHVGLFIAVLAGAIVILLIGFVVYMRFLSAGVDTNIQTMKDFMTSNEVVVQLKDLSAIKQKQKILTDYDKALTYLDKYVDNNSQVNSSLVAKLTSALPKTVNFTSFNLSQTELLVDGTAVDQQSVAEFVKKLKDLDIFTSVELVSVNQLKPTDSTLDFTIKCELKDVIGK